MARRDRPPLEMLEPADAARLLGIDYRLHDELGRFGDPSGKFETAGVLDRNRRIIAVATKFAPEVVRFTGAHEIGHWQLHPGYVMHRDRPIKGLAGVAEPRPGIEAEADHFAACFLMPGRLVTEAMQGKFCRPVPLVVDDAVAFHLRPDNPESLLDADTSGLERAVAVASAVSFNGRHFYSLAETFRVSVTSMAIRLKELQLVAE